MSRLVLALLITLSTVVQAKPTPKATPSPTPTPSAPVVIKALTQPQPPKPPLPSLLKTTFRTDDTTAKYFVRLASASFEAAKSYAWEIMESDVFPTLDNIALIYPIFENELLGIDWEKYKQIKPTTPQGSHKTSWHIPL